MTDQPDRRDEPGGLDPGPQTGWEAGSGTGISGLAAHSRRYRDLAAARHLRTARPGLAAVARPVTGRPVTGRGASADVAGTGPAPASRADQPAPRPARQRSRWAAPGMRVSAALLAILLGGVAATVLPDGVLRTRPGAPSGAPPAAPAVQPTATTIAAGTTTTAADGRAGRISGPVGGPSGGGPPGDPVGGQLVWPSDPTGPFGRGPGGGTPVRSPTSVLPPFRPGPRPGPQPVPTTAPTSSPPTTVLPPTTPPPPTSTSPPATSSPPPSGPG